MNTQGPAPSQPRASYAERSFLHTQTAAITVPLLQTVVISLMIAFAILVLTWLFRWHNGWKLAVAALAIMPIVTWIYLQRRWLLLTAETIFQQDFSGDGVVGPVETPRTRVVRVQLDNVRANGHIDVSNIFDVPADDEQLQALANGMQRGLPFSEKTWAGRGNIFSIPEWRKFCQVMLTHGIVKYRNDKAPQQGWELTPTGEKFFENYITSPTPPVDEA